MAAPIELYDTTLRDGTQIEGISLSVEDKLKTARKLAPHIAQLGAFLPCRRSEGKPPFSRNLRRFRSERSATKIGPMS
jgi:hypothetical protein